MQRLILYVYVLFLIAMPAFAQQRPLITEDIDITTPGTIEVSAGVDFLQNAKFPVAGLKGDLTRVGDIRVRTGLANNVEITMEGVLQNFLAINSQSANPAIPLRLDGNSSNDMGDIVVAAKVKFFSETKRIPAFGMKFGYEMPNSDQSRGIGTNQVNIFTKLIAQKKFGRAAGKAPRANIYGNIGLAIMPAPLERFTQNDVMLYGLAGIFRLTDNVNIASEVNGRLNTRGGGAPLGTESISQFRIGAQIKASNLRFDTAAIFGLTKYSPRSGITFGVTYQSPNIFKPAN